MSRLSTSIFWVSIYFKTLINKRLKFQPISQIIGERYFWKNKFIVSPNVLDPRPDTETLIEHTLSQGKFCNILDLGTGSGCIILSLLDEYKDQLVWELTYLRML